MRNLLIWLFILVQVLAGRTAKAQYGFLTGVPANERLKVLWRYCADNSISDKDSATTCRYLEGVAGVADSLKDAQLKEYAIYFRICFRVLFSRNYEQYFAKGDYESAAEVFRKAKAWALQNNQADIAAACEHYIGEVYFTAARYGLAFEHLLKADEAFRKIGYENVPAISIYLYDIALDYYRFEDWDKSLFYFLASSSYPTYLSRVELSTLDAIGHIYARKGEWDRAVPFYRKTIEKAIGYKNWSWLGIASGSLGNMFLAKGQNDSALFYHQKNYYLNRAAYAPEDAARSTLAIATVFIRQQHLDSALFYIRSGSVLAAENFRDPAEHLEYQRRLLPVMIEWNKAKGDYKAALSYSDSLALITDSLHQKVDSKLLNRAVEKTEAEQYAAQLKLVESQKSLSRLRFYVLIAVLLGIMITAAILFNRYRLRKLRQEQVAQKEKERISVEKKEAEEKLKQAEGLLTAHLNIIKEKTSLIENLDIELQRLKETTSNVSNLHNITANRESLLSGTILTDDDWRHFRNLFEQVHPGLILRLREKFPDLSPAELRLLILTKLNLSSREMANMLGISVDAIRKSRYRLRKKLKLEEESNLEELIQQV